MLLSLLRQCTDHCDLFVLVGDLHRASAHPAGAVSPGGKAQCWSCARPVGQPVLGAALCHQRWRGALQHPGTPGPAAQPDRAGSRPAPGLPRVLLTAPAAASLLACPFSSSGCYRFVFFLCMLGIKCPCSLHVLQIRRYSQGGGARPALVLGTEVVLAEPSAGSHLWGLVSCCWNTRHHCLCGWNSLLQFREKHHNSDHHHNPDH